MHPEIRNTLGRLIFAWFLMGTAIWQAQVTVAREAAGRQRTLPPPAATRHADRPPALPFSGDVEVDYKARCEKGLTDREIGWIVEDFQNAGLAELPPMDAPHAQLWSYRAAQQRWYHGLLADALRLSPEQSAQAAEKLAELFKKAQVEFERALNKPEADRESIDSFAESSSTTPIDPSVWLMGEEVFPWNLCQLTPSQEKITWKDWMEHREERTSFHELMPSASGVPRSREEMDTLVKRYLDRNPLDLLIYEKNPLPPLPEGSVSLDRILPLLRPFKDPAKFDPAAGKSGELPGLFQTLHPAQFKLALLLKPEIAGQLQRAINGETVETQTPAVPARVLPMSE